MRKQFTVSLLFVFFLFLFIISSCGDGGNEKDIVTEPEQMNDRVKTNISELLARIDEDGKVDDSTIIARLNAVEAYYSQSGYKAVWSSDEQFLSIADSLLLFIRQAKQYGLFPNDYHYPILQHIASRFVADTAAVGDRRDAVLWSKADVLLTDAFFHIAAHLHIGRLKVDSMYMNPDSVLTNQFYQTNLTAVVNGKSLSEVFHALEPSHTGYVELKKAVKQFIDSANFDKQFTYVAYPYKDSLAFVKTLVQRLKEEGMLSWQLEQVDSVQLKDALIKLQKRKELTVDGKFGVQVANYLNNTDAEKFKRIAINLDRYKVLPPVMPERYVWVNLPAYKLELWDNDTLRLESKVVVGKPNTRTPLLTSRISDMVTYPQWTIPNSIIMKEIVPAMQKNPGYLAKKGYSLMTWQGEEVDPYSVDWTK